MALSSVPLPCLAAARRAVGPVIRRGLEEPSRAEPGECCARMAGSDRSLEDAENVCASQPPRRVGRSPRRALPLLVLE